jgi:hypothetical protein
MERVPRNQTDGCPLVQGAETIIVPAAVSGSCAMRFRTIAQYVTAGSERAITAARDTFDGGNMPNMPEADQPRNDYSFDALVKKQALGDGDVTAAIRVLRDSELGLPHSGRSDGELTRRLVEFLNRAHQEGALTSEEAKQVLELSLDMVNRILKGELGGGHYAAPELATGWCEIAARAAVYADTMNKALHASSPFQDLSKFGMTGTGER